MGLISKLKAKGQDLVDAFMPPMDEYDEELELLEETQAKSASAGVARQTVAANYQEELKVANGPSISVNRPNVASTTSFARTDKSRPQLTVHTTKVTELKVQIFAPTKFDQVVAIADDLKAGKGCVVNYERVEAAEQRRICDFVNGVCYVLDGTAKRVSSQIVLYVPQGVDVAEAMSVALTD